ncbi:DMT family transporter [Alkalihalobacterium chitinilyticum]|uniref:EamA family transporter n=1 Tax=Alkalihalobacterium chitinilyticum TaxID=2980103 RepID=A0ABT5VG45_9BACI|nr:EamA family transporter [Alkalihalobacterium chitinilyticum]MDE5414443.1 EamA family transporter [Alkalihalobacterium chitinilyticum]
MQTTNTKLRLLGIGLVLLGAILWGVSGTVAQFLFEEKSFSAEWLVVIRLLIAGLLLLLICVWNHNPNVWKIWKVQKHRYALIYFGIVGMLGVQYTYFAAIEASNAATATLLQYLGPVFITVYIAIKSKALPTRSQVIAIFLALSGTFLLVTHGNFQTLSISGWALFLGIASALALAFYTLQPIQLLKEYGSAVVVGWGMVVGGVVMSLIHPPWQVVGSISLVSILAVLFVIIFGTLIAFYSYLESLKYLKATETSLLACAEPLSAAILAVIWLNVAFGLSEWIGAFCIMATIVILSQTKPKAKTTNNQIHRAKTN